MQVDAHATVDNEAPSLIKLGASFVYECLTVLAILLAGALIYLAIFGDATTGYRRTGLQLWLWLLVGSYYVTCWRTSGQTLAMQAWRLKVVRIDGQPLSLQASVKRYVAASLSLVGIGLGFLWGVVNQEHAFLHDQCLDTKIVVIPKT